MEITNQWYALAATVPIGTNQRNLEKKVRRRIFCYFMVRRF